MKPINGRQLKNAISRGLEVEVRVKNFDPCDDDRTENAKAESPLPDGTVYFDGMDFNPNDYGDEDEVFDEGDDFEVGLYPIQGIDYDREKEFMT